MGLRIRQSTIKGIASAVSKLHTIDERMLYEQIEQAISTHYPNYAPPSYDDDCLGLVEPQAFGDMMEDSDVEDTAEKGATGAILLVEEEEEEETDEVEITGEYILIRDDGSEPFIKQEFGAGLIWESLLGGEHNWYNHPFRQYPFSTAIRSVDALHSGFNMLPFLLSIAIFALIAGFTVSKLGYYVPHLILGPVLVAVGAGLITTFSAETSKGKWIGYQILCGVGFGVGAQQTNVAAQTVLQKKDIAIGSALMMFAAQISGAIFVPIGNAVFENEFLKRLKTIPGVDENLVLNTGATEIRNVVSPDVFDAVLEAYDGALTKVFLLATIMAALGLLPALCMGWKSVKKDQVKKGNEKV